MPSLHPSVLVSNTRMGLKHSYSITAYPVLYKSSFDNKMSITSHLSKPIVEKKKACTMPCLLKLLLHDSIFHTGILEMIPDLEQTTT